MDWMQIFIIIGLAVSSGILFSGIVMFMTIGIDRIVSRRQEKRELAERQLVVEINNKWAARRDEWIRRGYGKENFK